MIKQHKDFEELGGRLSVRVPSNIRRTVEKKAESEGRTISETVREVIIQKFKQKT